MENLNSFVTQIAGQNIVLNWSEKDIALLTMLGAALSESQQFEVAVSFFLASVQKQNNEKVDFNDLMNNHTSKTLGWLSQKLKSTLNNDKISSSIDAARKGRNFLVHNILKKYQWPFMSEQNYLQCMTEINEIRQTISDSEIKISQVLRDENILKLIVITPEDINQLESD